MGLKKNLISNVVLTTSTVFISFLTFPYITRTLSATNMGNVLFIDAFTQYFIIFSFLGIPFYGVREIARLSGKPDDQSRLVFTLVSLQFCLSIFLSIIFFALTFIVPSLHQNKDLVILGCLSVVATSFSIEWFYQGIENFTYITKRSLLIRVISVVAILFFVRHEDDQYPYYAILLGVIFLNSALNFGNYFIKFHRKFKGTLEFRPHIKPLLVLFSINVSVSVYTILDTIILGLFTNPISVSYYSVPLKLVKIIWVVVGSFSVVLIPRISKYFNDGNHKDAADLLKRSLSLVFLLTIPFAFLCIFFPREILTSIFGVKYLEAQISLQILSVVPLIIGVCNVFGTQFLLPIGYEKKILHATIFGLFTSLALNFLLIPSLRYVGSSIACITSETAVCLYVYIKAKAEIKIPIDAPLIILILVSCITTVIVGILIRNNLTNIYLISCLCLMYIIVFASLNFAFLKNDFINSLLKIKNNANG